MRDKKRLIVSLVYLQLVYLQLVYLGMTTPLNLSLLKPLIAWCEIYFLSLVTNLFFAQSDSPIFLDSPIFWKIKFLFYEGLDSVLLRYQRRGKRAFSVQK